MKVIPWRKFFNNVFLGPVTYSRTWEVETMSEFVGLSSQIWIVYKILALFKNYFESLWLSL